MRRIGREGRPSPVALLSLAGLIAGCGGGKATPRPATLSAVPLAVHRPEEGTRVFSADDEAAHAARFPFEGATGSVRVTMEVVSTGIGSAPTTSTPTIHEVLFKAVGDGRIAIDFRKSRPGLPEGRVRIRCLSGGEESEAEFEPEIWLRHPSAIVTFESPPGDPSERVAEGREVVLARYVARNLPKDIRLTLKAVFSKDPILPRGKAGAKPPR